MDEKSTEKGEIIEKDNRKVRRKKRFCSSENIIVHIQCLNAVALLFSEHSSINCKYPKPKGLCLYATDVETVTFYLERKTSTVHPRRTRKGDHRLKHLTKPWWYQL